MHPSAFKNKFALLGGIGLLVLTTSCGESTSSTSSSSNQRTSSYTPEPTQTVDSSISETPNNPFGECPHDISSVKEILTRKSRSVINNWSGNVPLNADLAVAIAIAEKVVQDPRCSKASEIAQLPELISASEQVLAIGKQRVNGTMKQAVDLQKSADLFR